MGSRPARPSLALRSRVDVLFVAPAADSAPSGSSASGTPRARRATLSLSRWLRSSVDSPDLDHGSGPFERRIDPGCRVVKEGLDRGSFAGPTSAPVRRKRGEQVRPPLERRNERPKSRIVDIVPLQHDVPSLGGPQRIQPRQAPEHGRRDVDLVHILARLDPGRSRGTRGTGTAGAPAPSGT